MDKTIIITGATGAMGWEATLELLRRGFRVIMAVRNEKKALPLRESLSDERRSRCEIRPLDLSDLDSVHHFADEWREPLWGLFNNAGTLQRHHHISIDGYELTLATNFIGPAVLSTLLAPKMEQGGVIVNTSSLSCYVSSTHRDFFAPPSHYRQVKAYADSKMALTLWSQAFATALDGSVRVNCTDPGIVDTDILTMGRWCDRVADILFRPLCKRPSEGIIPAIRALESNQSNCYFRGRHKTIPYPFSNEKIAQELYHKISEITQATSKTRF